MEASAAIVKDFIKTVDKISESLRYVVDFIPDKDEVLIDAVMYVEDNNIETVKEFETKVIALVLKCIDDVELVADSLAEAQGMLIKLKGLTNQMKDQLKKQESK